MDLSYRGLAFLLSLGTLPIACKMNDGDTDDTTTSGGSDGMTAGATGATETDGPSDACTAIAAKLVKCEPSLNIAEELKLCEEERDKIAAISKPECLTLFDEANACFAKLSCENGIGCDAERTAYFLCTPEIGPVCAAYSMKHVECFMDPAFSQTKYCQLAINEGAILVGPACGAAYEEYYVCMTGLDCATLDLGTGTSCEDKLAAADMVCG